MTAKVQQISIFTNLNKYRGCATAMLVVDGIDLADFVVVIAQIDMFGDGFALAVEHTFEVVVLAVKLHFDAD